MSYQSINELIKQHKLKKYASFKLQLKREDEVDVEYIYSGYYNGDEDGVGVSLLVEEEENTGIIECGDDSLIWVSNNQLEAVINFIKTLGGNAKIP